MSSIVHRHEVVKTTPQERKSERFCEQCEVIKVTSSQDQGSVQWRRISMIRGHEFASRSFERIREKIGKEKKWKILRIFSLFEEDMSSCQLDVLRLSAASSRAIQKFGKIELYELGETSKTVQCPACLKHALEGLICCSRGVCLRPPPEQKQIINPPV